MAEIIRQRDAHICQLSRALQQAGLSSQKDRIALNKVHAHVDEMNRLLREAEGAALKLDNDLNSMRQYYSSSQNELSHERTSHKQTRRELDSVRRDLDMVSRAQATIESLIPRSTLADEDGAESKAPLSVKKLLLELELKDRQMREAESALDNQRREGQSTIAVLEDQYRGEAMQLTTHLSKRETKIQELEQQIARQKMEDTEGERAPKAPAKRRRQKLSGNNTPRLIAVKVEEDRPEYVSPCPSV